jgi:hypothetical protein
LESADIAGASNEAGGRMTCEFCDANSGRYNMNLKCCQLRHVAAMPTNRRRAYYEQVNREQGKEAANALIAEINAIRKAKQGGKAA